MSEPSSWLAAVVLVALGVAWVTWWRWNRDMRRDTAAADDWTPDEIDRRTSALEALGRITDSPVLVDGVPLTAAELDRIRPEVTTTTHEPEELYPGGPYTIPEDL